jgi:glycosyltransferase involved in cell wall biosynthesis
MRIAVLGMRGFPDVQGGVENHCQNLYPYLVRLGCEVIVFARSPYVSKSVREYKGVVIKRLPAIKNMFMEAFLHTFLGVFAARAYRPHILHIHAIGPSFFTPLARLLGMKVIVTSHGSNYKHLKWGTLSRLFLRLCERIGIKSAQRIIAVSRTIAGEIRSHYRCIADYIPNGVYLPQGSAEATVLQNHGLETRRYILAVGRLVQEKGFHDLIEAYHVFTNRTSADLKLVITGGSDHKSAYSMHLKHMAQSDDRIVFTGPVSGVPLADLYANAALFVLPSYYEGLAIALLEAMSAGTPCIASDIPANRETGLAAENFFHPGNISELAEFIARFYSEPMSEDEKKRQKALVKEKYNWERIALETFAIYKAVSRI